MQQENYYKMKHKYCDYSYDDTIKWKLDKTYNILKVNKIKIRNYLKYIFI